MKHFYATGSLRDQFWGLRLNTLYLTFAGPKWPALYGERGRRGIYVLPLINGWRIRLRKVQS